MTVSAAPGPDRAPRLSQDSLRVLRDCRDLAAQRFAAALTAALDRISEALLTRAQHASDPKEGSTLMTARDLISGHRAQVIPEFERLFRGAVDDRIGVGALGPGARSESAELKLLDDDEMEETVIVGNGARAFENACEGELLPLTRRIGALLGNLELELVGNPIAPGPVLDAFRRAWSGVDADAAARIAVLRELAPPVAEEFKTIYADLNRHLVNLNVLPDLHAASYRRQAGRAAKGADKSASAAGDEPTAGDLMTALQRVLKRSGGRGMGLPQLQSAAARSFRPGADPGEAIGSLLSAAGAGAVTLDQPMVSALTRLQQGDSGFDFGDGTIVRVAAVAGPKHNVLRDIQESPLGDRMNQIDAMTIELVAMLFDFVFVDRNVPDSVKAMVGRLQIPVLKAAMLDRAFFSRKSHPARVLVNRLAHAGMGWAPEDGQDDPLYRKIESIVVRVTDGFTDDLGLFVQMNEELEAFLAEEEQKAEVNLEPSTDAIARQDRLEIGRLAASGEVERRLLQPMVPTFIVNLLRRHWIGRLERIHADEGETSDLWSHDLALIDDLVWSVQPKRSPEERRRLTSMLPMLIRRLGVAFESFVWSSDDRKALMGHLVEAHAAAVKALAPPPPAAGEEVVPPVRLEREMSFTQDEFEELASTMSRGMWVEFEGDDGRLAYAKLAWVSPLRGTLLFTNRQGQQAFSLTPAELAERFRGNRARPIDAEPLVDRAFSSMVSSLTHGADAAVAAA